MSLVRIKPRTIVLITTTRCTAACEGCCFGCNPKQGRTMTYEEMVSYIDKCLDAYPESIRRLSLTGGECMLLKKDIDKIIKYGKGKGLDSGMVSNAFWASSYDVAFKTLRRLKRCGLASISFSTGEDHAQFVPPENVINAAIASANLGLTTDVRVESRFGLSRVWEKLTTNTELNALQQQGKLVVSGNPWMYYHNYGKKQREWQTTFYPSNANHNCQSLFNEFIVNPYGEVYACCGIGMCKIPQLRLGNINNEPVSTIHERAFDDFLKIWLFTEGPQSILKYANKKGCQKFKSHTMHMCDMCRTVFTDKNIIPIIEDNFDEIASLQMSLYNFMAKDINEKRSRH